MMGKVQHCFTRHILPALRWGWVAVAFACALGLPTALSAQDNVRMTAKVQPEELRTGGTATFTITVENGMTLETPHLKLPENVRAISVTPTYSTQTSVFNGVRSTSTAFSWEITCAKNGRYVIPPQDVSINGKVLQTNETRLVVKDNPSTPPSPYDPMLTLEIEKRELYVGEAVPLSATLYLNRHVMLRRVGLIETPKENFAIQRFPQHPEDSVVTMGGESYHALTFHTTLSPLKPGKFKLGPASTDIIMDVPLDRNDLRGGFFPITDQRKTKVLSSDIELNVLPLPTEGKPANFTGVVGDFDVNAAADLRDLTVGDPISVEISVTGTGNFDTLSPPALTSAQPWKIYPARRTNIPRADAIPEGGTHSATFSQVLIPRQMTDFIPPFEFSYFSPTKKQFLTARTLPIALHMQPGNPAAQAAAKPLANTVEAATAEPEKVAPPQAKITDILTVLPPQTAWITPHSSLLRDHQFFVWNMEALGVIGLLIFGKLVAMLWRSQAQAAATPLHALRRELRRSGVPRGRFYQMAAQYVWLSHGASGPFPEPVQQVLTKNEQINYSPEKEKAGEPVPRDERAQVLSALKA